MIIKVGFYRFDFTLSIEKGENAWGYTIVYNGGYSEGDTQVAKSAFIYEEPRIVSRDFEFRNVVEFFLASEKDNSGLLRDALADVRAAHTLIERMYQAMRVAEAFHHNIALIGGERIVCETLQINNLNRIIENSGSVIGWTPHVRQDLRPTVWNTRRDADARRGFKLATAYADALREAFTSGGLKLDEDRWIPVNAEIAGCARRIKSAARDRLDAIVEKRRQAATLSEVVPHAALTLA